MQSDTIYDLIGEYPNYRVNDQHQFD